MFDSNVNVTHTKIASSEEEVISFLYETVRKQNKELAWQKELAIVMYYHSYWKETGTLPVGVLLSYAMPGAKEHFREFDELNEDEKSEIRFNLPPRLLLDKA